MTNVEIREILRSVAAALEVYRRNEGKLSAQDIRIKSVLSLALAELNMELGNNAAASSKGRSSGSL